jgi:hypothetical protein
VGQPGPPLEIEAGPARVIYWAPYHDLARQFASIASSSLRLPGIPDAAPPEGTRIYLVPSPALFDSLTGGRAPEWSAGVAIPALRTAVVPVYPTRLGHERDPIVTLRHELIHLILHEHLPPGIPRWFDEGFATWASGGWDQASAWQLRLAFLIGRAPPLDELTLDWPRGAEEARLAYLLSGSAVRYLVEIGGEHAFTVLLDTWGEEGSFEAAIRQVYGMTSGQFEHAWIRMVRRRYGWLLALSQITVFWTFAALLLVLLFGIRRRRKRERLAQLELQDLLDERAAKEAVSEASEDFGLDSIHRPE